MIKELSLINSRLDGRYDIQELLGRGSYAEIYVARDNVTSPQSTHKQVVVKALNVFMQNDLDTDLERTLVENFQNEAIALDRVRHPNIISRLGHGTARDLRGMIFHYLVLEFMAGGDLARATREKQLTLKKTFDYLEQVCAGLGHAHKNGVIHRDIKPQNLLLTADRESVKIADFGVARFSHSDSPITRVGTNIYAPPEHSPMLAEDGKHFTVEELTPAADIYSLAKSAYVLFTSESPRFFANQPIKEFPFHFRNEVWAKDLLVVLQKATQNNPKDRQQTVNEFWQDLSLVKLLAKTEDFDIKTKVLVQQSVSPKAHVARGYTPLAPQQPKFNTSRELKFENNQVFKNPALVVKVDHALSANTVQNQPLTNIPISQPPVIIEDEIIYRNETEPPKRRKSLLKRFAVVLLVLSLFTGILYGTHSYLRGRGIIPEIKNPFAKPTGVATNDVNLRNIGDPNGQKIGLVPKNSKVKIVNSNDNWYEIDVTEFGRPKENPADAEHGWVFKRYIDVDN